VDVIVKFETGFEFDDVSLVVRVIVVEFGENSDFCFGLHTDFFGILDYFYGHLFPLFMIESRVDPSKRAVPEQGEDLVPKCNLVSVLKGGESLCLVGDSDDVVRVMRFGLPVDTGVRITIGVKQSQVVDHWTLFKLVSLLDAQESIVLFECFLAGHGEGWV
jgi:hypothetical protein